MFFGYVGCFNVRYSCHACCSRIVCWLAVCCLFVLVVALLLGFAFAVWICLVSCWFCCVWVGVLAFGCGFVLLGGLNLVCWFCCVSCCWLFGLKYVNSVVINMLWFVLFKCSW